jgi:ssDNA-binding Zn-finger/Zn-ribbon topoisomerase 1
MSEENENNEFIAFETDGHTFCLSQYKISLIYQYIDDLKDYWELPIQSLSEYRIQPSDRTREWRVNQVLGYELEYILNHATDINRKLNHQYRLKSQIVSRAEHIVQEIASPPPEPVTDGVQYGVVNEHYPISLTDEQKESYQQFCEKIRDLKKQIINIGVIRTDNDLITIDQDAINSEKTAYLEELRRELIALHQMDDTSFTYKKIWVLMEKIKWIQTAYRDRQGLFKGLRDSRKYPGSSTEVLNRQRQTTHLKSDLSKVQSTSFEKTHRGIAKVKRNEETIDENCPVCGKPLVIKMGRFGKFLACSADPECHYRTNFRIKTGVYCPDCPENGELLGRYNAQGKIIYVCSAYPKHKFTVTSKPLTEPCPECGKLLIEEGPGSVRCVDCNHRIIITK